MLLPIGHEQTTVRCMPWVTLTIIGLCVLAFILTIIAPSAEGIIANRERRAVEFYLAHPYLELDPQLKRHTYYTLRQQSGPAVLAPEEEDRLRAEQRQLDTLVESVFEARDNTPFYRWGLIPARQRPAAWFTHMLMHAGLLHLLGNLFILYLVGPPMEDAWGHPLFAGFYVAAGVVAALFFVAGYPDIDEPLVGASGAIAGVMGAFAVRYWNTRITFFYWVFFLRIYTGTFAAPAWLMLGLWVGGQVAYMSGLWAFTTIADMGDVAFGAHVAGFVFGVAVALLIKKLAIEERFIEPSIESRTVVHEAKSIERAFDLSRQGRTDEGLALLEHELAHSPCDVDIASALWNLAVSAGAEERVAQCMVPPLEASARAREESLPGLCWGELLRKAPDIDLAPAAAVRLGEMVLAAGLAADAEETLHWIEDRIEPSTPVGQLVRLARMADELGVSAPFAELASGRSDLPPEVGKELRDIITRGRARDPI
jgi:membrane associated rhomboid family serine protease